jgi:hypothetical protein
MTDPLHERLVTLHTQTQPDSQFADQLESDLRAAAQAPQTSEISFKAARQRRVYRRLGALAASVVIVAGLFATVPPLRSFAEDVMNYFVPGPYTQLTDEEMAMARAAWPSVEVDTVAEAEAIAGFDILEWTAEGYQSFGIHAVPSQSAGLGYEKLPLRPSEVIWLEQYVAGSYGEGITQPVGDASDIQSVMVNGVQGEYVRGSWHSEVVDGKEGPVTWRTDLFRQLHWEKDNIVYGITVSVKIADTPEEVIALAESLR